MCGITGLFLFDHNRDQVDARLLDRMRDRLVHRGPDGGRSWTSADGRVGLAFRRLAIIDLSEAAMQPMSNEDGSLRVVFNGEIYNHGEIRRELESMGGHTWKTDHSDTEVILHAFETWGIDFLARLRGMFAIAIWDSTRRELWLMRDRVGIKPLYYSLQGNRLSFASEIKAILEDPAQKRSVNEEAFFHYLSFLAAPAPQTLFAGIQKLPGGSWLRVSADGSLHEKRYWDVWEHTRPLNGVKEDEISGMVLDELRTAVRYRKVSDVPVGVFLSGGIDSSTNAALFSEGETQPINTFTIGYAGQYASYRNETVYARTMADRVGGRYHERLLTQEDLLEFLPQMVYLQDEPIADPVCVPVYYVSKLARDNGVIVAQVGEGADELFWGYPWWKTARNLQRLSDLPVPAVLKGAGLAAMNLIEQKHPRYYELLRRSADGKPVFWGGAEAFSEREKQRLLSPRLKKAFAGRTSWEALAPIWDRFERGAWEPSALHWMTYLDLNYRLPELLLMRVDKMSMGVSLETRVPFLDHRFVELALSIPSALKTRNGGLKGLLKKSVRGLIPDEIIDRPKQGFGVPVYEWFFGALGETARSELRQFCQETDFLEYREVESYIAAGEGERVWFLLNFALWWKAYLR